MAKANPPVKKFKVGSIFVDIWKNKGKKGPIYSADFYRRYKDESGEWKTSRSFLIPSHIDDLMAAAEMTKSYGALTKRIEERDEPEEE